jgi:hypothetical protein
MEMTGCWETGVPTGFPKRTNDFAELKPRFSLLFNMGAASQVELLKKILYAVVGGSCRRQGRSVRSRGVSGVSSLKKFAQTMHPPHHHSLMLAFPQAVGKGIREKAGPPSERPA